MSSLRNIKPIKAWSPKVLPLVYDDSLSYYEQVCKVVSKLNEVVELVNNELEEYVRERIDALFINAIYDAETETLILTLGEEI